MGGDTITIEMDYKELLNGLPDGSCKWVALGREEWLQSFCNGGAVVGCNGGCTVAVMMAAKLLQ